MIDLLLALAGLAALSLGVLLSLAITLPVVRRRALEEGHRQGFEKGWHRGYAACYEEFPNRHTPPIKVEVSGNAQVDAREVVAEMARQNRMRGLA